MMTTRRAATALLALLPLLALTGCGDEDARFSDRQRAYLYGNRGPNFGGGSNDAQRKAADSVSYWDGDAVRGAPSIEIRIPEQRAYFYKGDVLVGISEVSTGREGHATPSGRFKVIQKDPDHRSSEYGDYVDANNPEAVVKSNVENGKDPKPPGSVFLGAPMPHFLRVTGGVGMHAGYLPGVPASHGCIRMPAFMATNFFENAPMGTPVTISN